MSFIALRDGAPGVNFIPRPPQAGQIAQQWEYLVYQIRSIHMLEQNRRRSAATGHTIANAAILGVQTTAEYLVARENHQLAAIQSNRPVRLQLLLIELESDPEHLHGILYRRSLAAAQSSIRATRRSVATVQQTLNRMRTRHERRARKQERRTRKQDWRAREQEQLTRDIRAIIDILLQNSQKSHNNLAPYINRK
ncbi:hypothetical protein PCASD_22969 [Puccinia coronata f. sp. avenae]|uniref:Uncharacterized protein n=1 Tax=Puccinia coronata f. sp. avenae TaxID=200324 RepID=A0A2N5S2L1_9BASI|nr:hypothetical protein PCASD_22969 [Puccinia coronata f. sp. avenae]